MKKRWIVLVVLLLAPVWAYFADQARFSNLYTEPEYSTETSVVSRRGRCADFDQLRRPFYGDLHVHTSLSLDARMQDTRTRPADAYEFAKGARIGIPPYGEDHKPLAYTQISRPLDFLAVTDHAEMLGENNLCFNPEFDGYYHYQCIGLRWVPSLFGGLLFARTASMGERPAACGNDGKRCLAASRGPWEEIQAAAAAANDESDNCEFTSFYAYEWTGAAFPETTLVANLHRNVIFKTDQVPDLPISFIESQNASTLYRQLDEGCTRGISDCDAVVIPHNSNISLGLMFQLQNPDGSAIDQSDARLRSRYERLAEIIQHKGASECYAGAKGLIPEDELCGFEQLPWNSFSGNKFESQRQLPQPDAGFLRSVLGVGLQQEARLGVNPFQFGFIGSTDTHRSNAGDVEEYDFKGHGGAGNPAVEAGTAGLPDEWEFNPGGLAVLYAEENSRESLFAAMQRREAYATSGPRISLRFFAGREYPENMCDQPSFVEQGYASGVPMGGVLKVGEQAPRFAVYAGKDVGVDQHPGNALQRLQLIKGWVNESGEVMEQVIDVAGDANNGASVDLGNCETEGQGFDELCTVYTDPAFNPNQPAYYYARAVENPSCRWSTRICNAQEIDCANPGSLSEEQAQCCNADMPKTVQERAWSSPIWYRPD